MKWNLFTVDVTIAIAALTATSAANPLLAGPAQIIGAFPIGLATATGVLESVALDLATGAVTVVTQAAVADADLVVRVIVAKAENS
jgi:hypothetical protein